MLLATDEYREEKLPKGSPGTISEVSPRDRNFIYSVEMVTQRNGYPRVMKTLRGDEIQPLPIDPNFESASQAQEDWRKQVQGARVSRDFIPQGTNQVARRGAQINVVSSLRLAAAGKIGTVIVPNGTAILLSNSRKAWDRAENIRANEEFDRSGVFSEEELAMDYQESVVVSVITAFAGLEAFINEVVPDDFRFADNTGEVNVWKDKKKIEREISISRKLADVLPTALNTISPKGREPLWSKFIHFRSVRNRIIHMTSADRLSSTPASPNLWHEIFSVPCPHQTALQMIDFFLVKANLSPPWRTNGPFES